MKRSRFTEEQIIGMLKEHELGRKAADICRKHGISEATFYSWKNKYGEAPAGYICELLQKGEIDVALVARPEGVSIATAAAAALS